MLIIRDASLTPPGGYFKYHHDLSDREFRSTVLSYLLSDIRKFCRDNNYPLLDPDVLQHQICEQNPDWCIDAKTRLPPKTVMLKNLVGTAVDWAKAGFPVSDEALAKERAETCMTCEFWSNHRCTVCGCSTRSKPWLLTAKCPKGRWKV